MKKLTMVMMAGALVLGSSVSVVGQDDGSTPDVPLGEDVSLFTGTEDCTSDRLGSTVVDGVARAEFHYTCETVTSDPRFSGTEEFDLIAYYGANQTTIHAQRREPGRPYTDRPLHDETCPCVAVVRCMQELEAAPSPHAHPPPGTPPWVAARRTMASSGRR